MVLFELKSLTLLYLCVTRNTINFWKLARKKKKKTETLQPGNDLQPNQLINERKKDGTTEIDAKDL